MELPTTNTATTERTDGAEAILVDFSDGLEALMAVPVWFLSTWEKLMGHNCVDVLGHERAPSSQSMGCGCQNDAIFTNIC